MDEMSFADFIAIMETVFMMSNWKFTLTEMNEEKGNVVVSFPFMMRKETITRKLEESSFSDIADVISVHAKLNENWKRKLEHLKEKYGDANKKSKAINFPETSELQAQKIQHKSAFKNRINTYIIKNNITNTIDIPYFLLECQGTFDDIINTEILEKNSVKIHCNLYVLYSKITDEERVFTLNTSSIVFFSGDDNIEKIKEFLYPQFLEQNENLMKSGSGWMYKKVNEMEIFVNKNNISRQAAGVFLELPPSLKYTKSTINIQSEDFGSLS